MKKITTNGRSFGTAQILTRQQLKKVMGGVTTTTKRPLTCNATNCGKWIVDGGRQQGTCSVEHGQLGDYCLCSTSGTCSAA